MNENLNLVEILKDCPQGTELYSTIHGNVILESVRILGTYTITCRTKYDDTYCVTSDGRLNAAYDGECTLFPNREERDWSKFKPKQSKFDPKTLQPFDKVLVRENGITMWYADMVSVPTTEGRNEIPIIIGDCYFDSVIQVIPYNDDTKHLVGTAEEAPEYYRYWED